MMRHNLRDTFLFACCLVAIFCITVFIGAVPTHVFGHDIFFHLDNGWRIISGQRPHIDYYSPWGPLFFLVIGLGLTLSNNSVNGIGYANAIVGIIIGLWTYRLARDRLLFPARILMSLYLVGLIVAPYSLGFGVFNSSHAMLYNRYGYALLGLLIIESFDFGKNKKTSVYEYFGDLSSGTVTALTMFLKVNYFVGAVFILAVSSIFIKFSARRLFAIFGAFSLISICILAYLRFEILTVLEDLQMAAGARSETLSVHGFIWKFLYNIPNLIFIVFLSFYESSKIKTNSFKTNKFRFSFICTLIFSSDLLILFTNQQATELPLTTIFSLIIINRAIVCFSNDSYRKDNKPSRSPVRYVLVAGGLFFMFFFTMQYAGLVYGALQKAKASENDSIIRFTEPHLAPLILYENESEPLSNGSLYTTAINDGIVLLKRTTTYSDSILTMDMMNPFSFALKRIPPHGGIAAAAYNYTLSDNHRPSEEKYFGAADIVMVPKRPASPTSYFDGYFKIYEAALHQRYLLTAESGYWYLYRRK